MIRNKSCQTAKIYTDTAKIIRIGDRTDKLHGQNGPGRVGVVGMVEDGAREYQPDDA